MATWHKGFVYCWLSGKIMLDIKIYNYFSLQCLLEAFCLLKDLKGKLQWKQQQNRLQFFMLCPLILYNFEQNLISRRTLNEMKLVGNILKTSAQKINCGYQVPECQRRTYKISWTVPVRNEVLHSQDVEKQLKKYRLT